MTDTITSRQLEIIEAAGRILSQSGVSGLTIKNLAKEMKFSESAIYRHFSSKDEIIIAMLNYLSTSLDTRYENAISENLCPEENFRTLFQNQFSFFHENPHFAVSVFSDGLMEKSDQINHAILDIMKVKIKHLKPIILEGQEKNVFTDEISADELIHIVMGAIRLLMFKWRVENFQFHICSEGNKKIKSLLTILKK